MHSFDYNHIVFEEKLNIFLSQLLNTSGIISKSELLSPHARRDILVSYQGLNIVIEGSYSKSDAMGDAQKRVDQLGNDVAIAICYPKIFFQNMSETVIKNKLKECNCSVKLIVSKDTRGTPSLFPNSTKRKMVETFSDWQHYYIGDLIDLIKELGQFIISEEGMVEIENEVNSFIDSYVFLLNAKPQASIIAKNLYHILYELYGFSFGDPEDIKEAIFAQSILSILLSSIYYETIRYVHGLKPLHELKEIKNNSQIAVKVATEKILAINYELIFKLTNQLLSCFPPLPKMFDQLIKLSSKIASKRTFLRKDIAGRIYHRIVGDWSVRKNLATFYTSIPSAYLLVYLAEVNLSRICDFACGSGTLLTAAYSAANTRYRYDLLKHGTEREAHQIEEDFHNKFIKIATVLMS